MSERQPYHQRPPLWGGTFGGGKAAGLRPQDIYAVPNTQKTLGIPSHGTGGLSGACSDHKTWIYPMGPWGFRGRIQGNGGDFTRYAADKAGAQPHGMEWLGINTNLAVTLWKIFNKI